MLNNQYILDLISFISNKSQSGNTLSPSEFNTLLEQTNLRLFKSKTSDDSQYKVGQPLTDKAPEITQKITDDLMPFKVWLGADGVAPLTVQSNGNAVIPDDFYYPLLLTYKNPKTVDCDTELSYCPIEVVTDNQWGFLISHSIRKPSLQYPICNFQNNYIRFAPKNLLYVDFNYLKYPIEPFYDYYISSIGEFVYLPPNTKHTLLTGEQGSQGQISGVVTSQSVELEWNDTCKLEIVGMILETIGVNLREANIVQYSQQMQQQ